MMNFLNNIKSNSQVLKQNQEIKPTKDELADNQNELYNPYRFNYY